MFHYGHWNLLRRASYEGDELIVFVSTDEFNRIKGKESEQSQNERAEVIETLDFVTRWDWEETWEQKLESVNYYKERGYKVKVVMGDDWKGKFDDLPCEVIYLPRTPIISSTKIREMLK